MIDFSGHDGTLIELSIASAISTFLETLYNSAVLIVGFAVIDTIKGVEAGKSENQILIRYLIEQLIGIGAGIALAAGSLFTRLFSDMSTAEAMPIARRLASIFDNYWELSGGIAQSAAEGIVRDEGFQFEIGSVSRFENARNAVVIARSDLLNGDVNRLLLAEEIQHGLDRTTFEASRAISRGLDNNQFHSEVFQRILDNFNAGKFKFLTKEDIGTIQQVITTLKR